MRKWEECSSVLGFVLFFDQMKMFLFGLGLALAMAFLESTTEPPAPSICLVMPSFDGRANASTPACTKYRQPSAAQPSEF